MRAPHNQHQQAEDSTLSSEESIISPENTALSKIKKMNASSLLLSDRLPNRMVPHDPKAGLNPLVDTAARLFSALGKLKSAPSFRQLTKLQKELIEEITLFQEAIKHLGYNAEYVLVCRYALCATFDDIMANTTWGGQGQWDNLSLLVAFNQDMQHHDKFFTILERAIKEPALYIDLMELMYICLTMGYKGQYRATEHSQYQLEQITNNLYKHIRVYRGNISKTLSPAALKMTKSSIKSLQEKRLSLLSIFFISTCIIMTLFVSLGYLMDALSNEAFTPVTKIENVILNKSLS